jgi:SpoVK/Ycf46/Vps4 family AAA+-type ATPase
MNLSPYIKASYPILYLLTAEEARAEMQVLKTAQECKRNIRIWSHTEGFFTPDPQNEQRDNTEDPIDALTKIKAAPAGTIFVFRDLHSFFQAPRVIRLLRDIARDFKQSKKTLVLIAPVQKLPPELERDVTVIEFELPSKDELGQTLDSLCKTNKIKDIEADEKERIVQAAMGLTTCEAEAAFAKAFVERAGSKDKTPVAVSSLVLCEKAATVKKTGILEYFHTNTTANDIGGLDNLKKWMGIRSKSFSKKAREFGLPMPRGILLVGLPGCGKSLTAKAASNILGVPLIKFDVGRVFGGLVGESEQNMRTAIQTAEAIGSCVLWIDEMEKAFAGMMNSNSGDSGTSQRVFGNFITWMQEKTCPTFIVATVNRIEGLPPEMLRKGRFDEIFFVGLPSAKEREEILKIHVKKYNRDPKDFNLTKCVKASEGFSGAELEEAIVSGMYAAFHHERELNEEDVLKAVQTTNPLSRSKAEQLAYMAKWATENAINASVDTNGKKDEGEVKTQAGRQLEL